MIQDVRIGDIQAIGDLYNHYVVDSDVSFETEPLDFDKMLARVHEIVKAGFPYFVWEEDGKTLGFCCAHPWKERAAYFPTLEVTLYLAPEVQGKGIGPVMLNELIDRCRKIDGIVSLIACITANNEPSIKLCEKMGFKKASHFTKVGYKHGQLLDVVDYQLML
ncbi:MAG: N-acetyltransferase family protein [Bacteroidales bacterium]|nr:N-acetyltransferase family protein [Bacteroidales bacterium]